MTLTPDQQRVKMLLTETITLLCKNGLSFKSEFSIEALVGITIDNSDVILLSIKETISTNQVLSVASDGGTRRPTVHQTTQKSDGSQSVEIVLQQCENQARVRKRGRSNPDAGRPETPKHVSTEALANPHNDLVTPVATDVPSVLIASSDDENDSNSFAASSAFSESESFLTGDKSNSVVERRRKKRKLQHLNFEDIPATVNRAVSTPVQNKAFRNYSLSDVTQEKSNTLASSQELEELKGEQLEYSAYPDFREHSKVHF